MTSNEANNRASNLLATGTLCVLAAGVLPVAFIETEWVDRYDDLLVGVVAAVAIVWYLWGRNRIKWSVVPGALVALALILKVATVFATEATDKTARGDDIGVMVGFALATVMVGWQLWKTRPQEHHSRTGYLPFAIPPRPSAPIRTHSRLSTPIQAYSRIKFL